MGPHGDCGLRDSVSRRLLAGCCVQLFYVGTLNFLWCRRLFDLRFLLPEFDQESLLILGCQKPNSGNSYGFHSVAKIASENDFAEAGTDTAGWRVEHYAPAAPEAVGPSAQYHVILASPGSVNDEILLIEDAVSSDT